jgi:hypothetical protein
VHFFRRPFILCRLSTPTAARTIVRGGDQNAILAQPPAIRSRCASARGTFLRHCGTSIQRWAIVNPNRSSQLRRLVETIFSDRAFPDIFGHAIFISGKNRNLPEPAAFYSIFKEHTTGQAPIAEERKSPLYISLQRCA